MATLDFKAFKPTATKVKLLQFHPVQPWVAYVDTNQLVVVWNWSTEQVVCDFVLSTAEEAALHDLLLKQLAEKDPQFYGSAASESAGQAKTAAPGAVRDLSFLDMDTCYWQLASQHIQQLKAYSSSGIPHIGRVRGLKGHRWLVLACETKVVLRDLRSGEVREVPRGLMDSRAPTRLAFLFVNSPSLLGFGSSDTEGSTTTITPVLAVGTSSGAIFLVSLTTLQVHARLVGGHKTAVTALVTLSAREPGAPDALISASVDGTVAVWHPSTSSVKLPDKEVAPKTTFKAHDGEILSAALIASPVDSPEAGQLNLVTAGEDKRVAVWDATTWKEVVKAKPLAKGACDSIAFSPRAGACCNSEPSILLVSGERPCIWGMYPTTKQLETVMLANLEQLLLPGAKKVPKIYVLACHPLQPHLVAVGANAGVGLLSFNPAQHVPAAGLPLQLPAASDLDSPRAGSPFRGCEYLFASESALWQVSFRQGWREDVAGKHLTADLRSKRSVSRLPRHGRAEVQVSHDATCCSVVWPEEGEYAIFKPASAGEAWDRLDGGPGIAVAWAAAAPLFAVLHTPRAAEAKKQRKRIGGKGKEDESAHPSAALLAAGATVQVYRVSDINFSAEQVCREVAVGGEPIALHGGAMLGVALTRSSRTGSRKGRVMRLVSWKSFSMVGEPLAEPTWLAWDPDATCLALGYPDSLVLCRTRPTFSAFATLSFQGTYEGLWQRHQLFVVSPTAVICIFVAAGPESPTPYAEVVRIASLGGGVSSQAASVGSATAALPAEGARCAGPVALIGMREGALWLVDARGLPFVLPMSHPGMRARAIAGHGDAATACFMAEHGLWRHHHDGFARFVAAVCPTGAERALQLSGLTLAAEAVLSRKAGALRRAVQCLVAAAAGAHERAALNLHALWHARVTPGQAIASLDALISAAGPQLEQAEAKPALAVLEQLPPPPAPPPPEEPPKEADQEPREAEETPEAPQDARRRHLLRILIPDDNEAPISDDELEEEAKKPAPELTDEYRAGSESDDYDDVDFAGTRGRRAPAPDPGVPINWDLPLASAATNGGPHASASTHANERSLPDSTDSWLLHEALALVDAAVIAGDKEVAGTAARLALHAAGGAPRERQVAVLLQCAKCELLGEVSAALRQLHEGAAAPSPASHTVTLAAALADNPVVITSALQASGMAAAAAIYTHAWRSGDSIKALAAWSTGLNGAVGDAAKYSVSQP